MPLPAHPTPPTRLARMFPPLQWLRRYRRGWLREDVVAGLSASAVVIPQAMAYASLAGMPIEAGLFAAMIPQLLYALLGTSRPLSVSTTSTICLLTATALSRVTSGKDPAQLVAAAATLAVLIGGLLLLAGILRLGFISTFISRPVLTGFKAGTGLVIAASQLGKLTGTHLPHGHFVTMMRGFLEQLGQVDGATLALGAITIAAIYAMRRWTPRVPNGLVAVGGGILAAHLLSLGERGVQMTAAVPSALPHLVWPTLSYVEALLPAAAGIALMTFVESVAAARTLATREDIPIDPSQELRALGAAGILAGLFGSVPTGGGLSQTVVNEDAGARSQFAGLVTAAVSLLTLLVLAPVFEDLADATLGAVVMVAAIGMVKPGEFRSILAVRRQDFALAVLAMLGVTALGTLEGVLVAVLASASVLIYQSAHPRLVLIGRKPGTAHYRSYYRHPGDELFDGLLVVRPEGSLYFVNEQYLRNQLMRMISDQAQPPRVVLIDAEAIPDLEYTAVLGLQELERALTALGVEMWLASLNERPLEVVRRSGLSESLGEPRMFPTVDGAVTAFLESADPEPG